MPAGPAAAAVLRLTAAVLRYLQQRDGAISPAAAAALEAAYPPLALARLVAAARTLLGLAERAGWPATARLLRPAVAADGRHPGPVALQHWEQQHEQQPGAAADALPAPPPRAPTAAAPRASGSGVETPKAPPSPPASSLPGGSGKGGAGSKLSADEAGLTLPVLDDRDRLRRAMHPAVLGAVTLAVAGLVLGMGAAMAAGHLG